MSRKNTRHRAANERESSKSRSKSRRNYTQLLCDICGKSFKQTVHFNQHECFFGNRKPYSCNFDVNCDKTFNNVSNRKKHVDAVHLNLRKYQCQHCEKIFKASGALKTHLSRIHSVGKHNKDYVAKYTCKLCGKFLSPSGFKAHLLVHSGEKNLTCSYGCGRQFYDKSNLKKHEMVHSGVKPHKCSACGESFSRKQYLDSHMWKHTGMKRFQCELCPRYFSQKGNRDIHLKNHSGEKWFSCSDCGKNFNVKSNLTAHLQRHEKHRLKSRLRKSYKTKFSAHVSTSVDCKYVVCTKSNEVNGVNNIHDSDALCSRLEVRSTLEADIGNEANVLDNFHDLETASSQLSLMRVADRKTENQENTSKTHYDTEAMSSELILKPEEETQTGVNVNRPQLLHDPEILISPVVVKPEVDMHTLDETNEPELSQAVT